jgi:hypothetical protein
VRIILAALLILTFNLSACCLQRPKASSGLPRDKVATEITQLVRGIHWQTVSGTKACTPDIEVKELSPKWAQITVSMLEQTTNEANSSVGTGIPVTVVLPITPTLGYDLKNQSSVETDTVIIVDRLREYKSWPALADQGRQAEADKLSKLLEDAERDLVLGGDSDKPCLAISNVAISTVLDITETENGELKIGIGPIAFADIKGNHAKESKATLKFEIHYAGEPPPGSQQQLLQRFLDQQMTLFQQQEQMRQQQK